jgi:MFS family permease
VYGLGFLDAYPAYQCLDQQTKEWQACERDTICDSGMSADMWRINYDDASSFKNWVDPDKLNLTCTSKELIGMLGSLYFLGFAISAGVVPRLADKWGRKWPYIASLSLQLAAYVQLYFSKSIYYSLAMYLIVGLSAGGRVAIGTTYLNEFVPSKYQNIVTTTINVGDSSTMIFQAIYYYFNRDWMPLHTFGLVASALILFAVF